MCGDGTGFVPASGTGTNGVLIVGEAAAEHEAAEGEGFVGKAGHYLFSELRRVGIERDGFRIANVLACRPPDNKLVKTPYEAAAIDACRPILDKVIEEHKKVATLAGRTPVILTLGKTAFKRVMGAAEKSPLVRADYLCYPHWSDTYQCWVVAADHPSYLMRGNHHLVPVLCEAAQRALHIAKNGLTLDNPVYLLDPTAAVFQSWIEGYLRALAANPDLVLSYDIETPMKKGKSEEEVAKKDDDDYTILRVSFCYAPGNAVSVPWTTDFLAGLETIFNAGGPLMGWNSQQYDDPRVNVRIPLGRSSIDGMLAFHVLNSSLPKGLGFVTPFYAPTSAMWKHLSSAEPAYYNAKDADMALRNWIGIEKDLKENGLWEVFDRHVLKMNIIFGHMSKIGLLRDEVMRGEAETRLSAMLVDVKAQMEAALPMGVRPLKVYKKTPKDLTGLVLVDGMGKITVCPGCSATDAKAAHFKSVGKKKLKSGVVENPCVGLKSMKVEIPVGLYARPLEFKVSMKSMMAYQKAVNHRPIFDPKEKKVTFNEKAIIRLMKKYPADPLYPKILERRELQGLLSKYIGVTRPNGKIKGGLTVGKDGAIHATFSHNPSTLRSAVQNPPLQQLPRPSKDPEALANIIRNLVVARPGMTFLARDYSGIEAVLVGYFAADPGYVRLAKMDVHSFYTAYALNALDGRVKANDLPLLSWDDDRLRMRLAEIKKEFSTDRNNLFKHLVHGANFKQGPQGAAEKILLETGINHPVTLVKRVMDIYFELFGSIPKWHKAVLEQASKDGFLRNPFGYVHRFSRVWSWEKIGPGVRSDGVIAGPEWVKSPGPQANEAIANLPQSSAAGIIKESLLRLYFNRYEEAGQYLRLLVHDENFCEVPTPLVAAVDLILKEEMERPITQMPLPPSWNMGEYLTILTEAKAGPRWGQMKELKQ